MVQSNFGLENYLKIISSELALNRQEFTEVYETFTSNELCKEYKNYMEKTSIEIYTLTVNIEEKLTLLLNSAMTRISSSINDLVSNPSLMIISNRETYELMHNLINQILLNDPIKSTKLKIPLIIIVITYFVISIIILFTFLKLLSIFSLEREKPINLFLTIKKGVFENLKNSAENFSNKLLNKFFGNEDNEEESKLDSETNIQPNDINIAKFKAANEYDISINKAFDFLPINVIIIIFLLINLMYLIFKYANFRKKMDNITQFLYLFDKMNIAKSDFILSIEIFKSYLFNKSIPILNNNTKDTFIDNFLFLTSGFEDSIIYTSKTKSFLNGEYLQKYEQYYLGDFRELLDKDFLNIYSDQLNFFLKYRIKPIQLSIFEIIRYITIVYCIGEIDLEDDSISILLSKGGMKIFQLNLLAENMNRKWFDDIVKLMINSIYEYQNNTNLIYIIDFICLLIIVILYYLIVWRINYENLKFLLKESVDLINLIPHEIKNIIIEKLNE